MVGDAQPVPSHLLSRIRHDLKAGLAVRKRGVVVERPFDMTGFDEVGQRSRFGGDDLPHVLSQFRRNIGEVEMSVDGRLISSRQRVNRCFHALQIACFCLGNQAEFIEP